MKDYLSYLGLRIGVGLVGAVPGGLVRRLGRAFGAVWAVVDRKRRAMARRHAARVVPDGDADRISGEMMRSYGRYFAEALWARSRRVEGMLADTEVIGLERILAARDAGTGMIYALPHMGNWEAAANWRSCSSTSKPPSAASPNARSNRLKSWRPSATATIDRCCALATYDSPSGPNG